MVCESLLHPTSFAELKVFNEGCVSVNILSLRREMLDKRRIQVDLAQTSKVSRAMVLLVMCKKHDELIRLDERNLAEMVI